MIKNFVYILTLIVIVSSCVTSKRVNYLQEFSDSIPVDSCIDSVEYQLHMGDRIYITISTTDVDTKNLLSYGMMGKTNNLSDLMSYEILQDGNIVYPYVGKIQLLGLTTRQAKDTVKDKLRIIIPDCDIDIKLLNPRFTIIGSVENASYIIDKEKINIFQALAKSGDLNDFSEKKKIHILRQTINGDTKIKIFDIRNKDIIDSEYYYVFPNDIIYVQSFNGQFFSVKSFSQLFSTVSSTLSLGYLLYNLSLPLYE